MSTLNLKKVAKMRSDIKENNEKENKEWEARRQARILAEVNNIIKNLQGILETAAKTKPAHVNDFEILGTEVSISSSNNYSNSESFGTALDRSSPHYARLITHLRECGLNTDIRIAHSNSGRREVLVIHVQFPES